MTGDAEGPARFPKVLTLVHGTQSGFCWLVDQVKEINMPMLFWLPAIIVSGWWSMVAKELDVQAARLRDAGPSR